MGKTGGALETVVRNAADSLAGINYFFTLICNGTPVHISQDVGEAMFHGGLLNRFLVFAAAPSHSTRLPSVSGWVEPGKGSAELKLGFTTTCPRPTPSAASKRKARVTPSL